MLRVNLCVLVVLLTTGCAQHGSAWNLLLSHDARGTVNHGSQASLVAAVRQGCQLRVAWGARRKADPSRTIEHIATPLWVSVRDGTNVEIQIGGFMANQRVLGEPIEDHPRYERFGGTNAAVMWRAGLKTDGSFNAIWYRPDTGALVERVPQNHPMKWFADCRPDEEETLFSE